MWKHLDSIVSSSRYIYIFKQLESVSNKRINYANTQMRTGMVLQWRYPEVPQESIDLLVYTINK